MGLRSVLCATALGLSIVPMSAPDPAAALRPGIEERTAPSHPMHYFVSLPADWAPTRRWPVVVVIPDAFREFEQTAREFAVARRAEPFIIVVPMVLSGGGTAQQHRADFDYGDSAWALAGRVGNCAFDEAGLTAVLQDVLRRYHTEDRVFLTGWEAGGHVVAAQLLLHPERLQAVALVTPNFIGRCIPNHLPPVAAGGGVPVRIFHGTMDSAWAPDNPLRREAGTLERVLQTRGLADVKDSLVPAAGHGSLASDVLRYFASLEPR